MEQRLGKELKLAGSKAQYDEHAKALLAHKEVLAQILIGAAAEFKGMKPEEVIPYIEDEAQVGIVPVLTGETNALPVIKGANLESRIPSEGLVTYDVRFYVRDPHKEERIEIIVDIEAQKENPGYDLVTRGIFYNARQISAQLDRDFKIPEYNDIKKVYSIWICMNSPKKLENSIVEYTIQPRVAAGKAGEFGKYDLQTVVLINLSKEIAGKEEDLSLLRYLGTLFSPAMEPEKKIELIEKEYGMVKSDVEKEVNGMCNLSDWIWEDGIERGIERGIEKGIEKGLAKKEKEIALKMLHAGKANKEILEFLTMTEVQLEELRAEM